MDKIQTAWLAGLLEGEGCFLLVTSRHGKARREYSYPHVVVTMTDRDVIERVGKLLSAPVQTLRPSPAGVSKKIQYRVKVGNVRAVALMKQIRPYMGERRGAKIDELLEFEANRPNANAARREWSSEAASKRQRNSKGQLV